MSPLLAALLGLIEGFTEFLPISSTGHLILATELLRLPHSEFQKTFDIAIQLGAILAVVVLYWRRLLQDRRTLGMVAAAFAPTAVLGFLFHDIVKTVLLESVPTVLWSLFLGGIVLIVFELLHKEKPTDTARLDGVTLRQALMVGFFQSIAMIPGVSRSAATIIGGQLMGLSRTTVVEFSFLLAVPTMAAATGLDLLKSAGSFTAADMTALGIGFVVSFVTALVAIRWLLTFVQRHSFVPFGLYRIAVAIIAAWWLWL